MTNEPNTVAHPRMWPHASVRLPPTSRISAPASGSAIITHVALKMPVALWICWTCSAPSAVRIISRPLVLQQVRVVDGGRAPGPLHRHDDRQTHHDLRSGHDH